MRSAKRQKTDCRPVVWYRNWAGPSMVCRADDIAEAFRMVDVLETELEMYCTNGGELRCDENEIEYIVTDSDGYRIDDTGQRIPLVGDGHNLDSYKVAGIYSGEIADTSYLYAASESFDSDGNEILIDFSKDIRRYAGADGIRLLRKIYSGGDYDDFALDDVSSSSSSLTASVDEPSTLLLIRCRGEGNDTPQHAILTFHPTDAERLVLDLQRAKSCFAPHGPDSGYALGNYFACKYRPRWRIGKPADQEDDSDNDDTRKFTWTLCHWAIQDYDCDHLLREHVERYLDHIKAIARTTDTQLEQRDQILALTIKDFAVKK
jgi:hypothetical protein